MGAALKGQQGASWGPGSSAPRLWRLCRGVCVTRSAEACTDVHTRTNTHAQTHIHGFQCISQEDTVPLTARALPRAARLERGGAGSESTFSSHVGGATRPPQGQRCSGPRESESCSVVSAERPQSSAPSADPQAHSTGVCSSPPQPHGSLLQGLSLMLPQAPFCLLGPGSGVSPSPVQAQRKPSFCFLPDPGAAPSPPAR